MSRRVVEFTEAGFTREDLKHIVCRHPSIFNLSFQQNVLPKLLLLRGLGIPAAGDPLTEQQVRQLVVKYPGVLTLSFANIESKLKYLVTELRREGHEILTCPSYLASSMNSWILPRVTYLQALGLNQQRYALGSIFKISDAVFCKRMGIDEEDYIAFKHSMQN